MRLILLLSFFLYCSCIARAQQYTVKGLLLDEVQKPAPGAGIWITDHHSREVLQDSTGADGLFVLRTLTPGLYYLHIRKDDYADINDSFRIVSDNIDLGKIRMRLAGNMLDEVKVRLQEMQQHNDTLEYLSAGFKVSEDASASDLVRKMPAISLDGNKVMAQGETVLRVLVDGKPFFGDDALATLKNLPADIVAKVQVFNEKSEQEKFTGFNEGPTAKTINIVTKEGRNRGSFGKVYAGYGSDNNQQRVYTAGTSVNYFGGERRISLTTQLNNVNGQYFSDNANAMFSGGRSSGLTSSGSAGLNYSDRLGKKIDFSGSYYYNKSNNSVSGRLDRIYVLATDSGQTYKENRNTTGSSNSHVVNASFRYEIDSANSIQWQSQLNLSGSNTYSLKKGITLQNGAAYNTTTNDNTNKGNTWGGNSNLLMMHRFRKKGRTMSLNLGWTQGSSSQDAVYHVDNVFSGGGLPVETINQKNQQQQDNRNLTGDLQFTESIGRKSMLKWQYAINSRTASSDRNTANYALSDSAYSLKDTALSGILYSRYELHKTGLSYQVHWAKLEYSAGLNYQYSRQVNETRWPVSDKATQSFNNLLLTTTLQYKISTNSNLRTMFATNTQNPGVNQMQSVVNNTDPLHLSTGNPALKQANQYMLNIQYNGMNSTRHDQFSVALRSSVVRHFITSTSVIAAQDTTVLRGIFLPRGSQLTFPVNAEGYATINGNMNYALPFNLIRSNLNFSANVLFNRVPGIINGQENIQSNRTLGLGAGLTSNISEQVDFMLTSNANIISNSNSLNAALSKSYRNYTVSGYLNIQLKCGILFNTSFNYQSNAGLGSDFNQDYLLWNLSAGYKFLKHKQGDIRFMVFDVLNKNRNITYQVTQSYEETGFTNNLQRYFMLVLSYKLRGY